MSLTFYTNPNSRGRVVRWMLEEVGCDYDVVVMDYQKTSASDQWGGAALEQSNDPADPRSRFFTEINPIGKIPVIVHNGAVISETAAICMYLAETFPAAGLMPTPAERADYLRWVFFVSGPLDQANTNRRAGFVPAPEQEFFFGYGSFERAVDQLERAVRAHPYIAGDRFTAADVYVGTHVGWGLGLQSLPPRQAFVDYAARVTEREAYARAVAKDAALLVESV